MTVSSSISVICNFLNQAHLFMVISAFRNQFIPSINENAHFLLQVGNRSQSGVLRLTKGYETSTPTQISSGRTLYDPNQPVSSQNATDRRFGSVFFSCS